jgi:hypothetical protein
MYLATNAIHVTSTGGLGAAGKYNVVVNNDQVAGPMVIENQRKTNVTTPIRGVLVNNVGVGVSRDKTVPNWCDPTIGDLVTIASNRSIPVPYPSFTLGSSVYCPGNISSSNPGVFTGLSTWTSVDYRSNVSGVTPLFTALHPLDPPFYTTNPSNTNPCVRATFFTTGNCALGASGIFDLVPNKSFPGTPQVILGTYSNIGALPHAADTGGTNGDAYVAGGETCPPGQVAYCGAQGTVWPAGVYIRQNAAAGNSTQWQSPIPPYIPSIASAGTALGSLVSVDTGLSLGTQTPITDHDGYAWGSPPSIGAYEVVGALPFSCPSSGLQFNAACNSINFLMQKE